MASSKYLIGLALLAAPALSIKATPRVCDEPAVFSLSRFDYATRRIYSTPSHQAFSSGNVSFVLSNSAGEYDLDCEAISNVDVPYYDGTKSYSCTPQDSYEPTPFAANFTFNKAANAVSISAKYGCYNFLKRSYDSFEAKVAGTLNLTCDDRRWENKNWTVGTLYSVTGTSCDTGYLELKPEARLTSSRALVPPAPPAPKFPGPPPAPAAPPASPKPAVLPTSIPPAKAAPPPKASAPAVVAPPPKVPVPVLPKDPKATAALPPTPPSTAAPTPTTGVDDLDDDEEDDDAKRRHALNRISGRQ